CDYSCEKSTNQLLDEQENRSDLDTVPVLLYCKDGCAPFKGYGAHHRDIGHMMASYYFRVNSVQDDCCAVLELLRDPNDGNPNPCDPLDQRPTQLRATGICITVAATS